MKILTSLQKLAGAWQPKGLRHLATGIVSALAVCTATTALGQVTVTTLGGGPNQNNPSSSIGNSPTGSEYPITFGGTQFNGPSGIAVDNKGNLFMADFTNGVIRKVTSVGNRTSSGTSNLVSGISMPIAVAVDSADFVYVLTAGGTLSKYTSKGVLASNLTTTLTAPTALTIGPDGNLYVTELGGALKKVDTNSVTTTLMTGLTTPRGVTALSTNLLAVTDGHAIREFNTIDSSTSIRAGSVTVTNFMDGTGGDARFNSPRNIAAAPNGTIVVADYGNHRVRLVTAEGIVQTLYGVDPDDWGLNPFAATYPGWVDTGTHLGVTITNAHAREPFGVAVAPSGTSVFVTEQRYALLRAATGFSLAASTGGGTSGGGIGNTILTTPLITLGFATGEGSSVYRAVPGQFFYVPVTMTTPIAQQIYSLGFTLAMTNMSGPVIPEGEFGFQTMLKKPIPNTTPVIYTEIPNAVFLGTITVSTQFVNGSNVVVVSPDLTNTMVTNASARILGVSWVEVPGKTNLYNTVVQDLITYSQAHLTMFEAHNSGKAILGAVGFQVPPAAVDGNAYRIQVLNASATSNLTDSVTILTPTNGSIAAGAINAIKEITVTNGITYLVGDSEPFRWLNAGDFGSGKIDIQDIQVVLLVGVYEENEPPVGSDFFNSMDSSDGTNMDGSTDANDGDINIADLLVSLRRATDPYSMWFRREAGSLTGTPTPNGLDKPTFGGASANNWEVQSTATTKTVVNVRAGDLQASPSGVVQVPITVSVNGPSVVKNLMFGVAVEPLDGAPGVIVPVTFQQTSSLLATWTGIRFENRPSLSVRRDAASLAMAWTDPFASGLGQGDHLLGNLVVTLPSSATASSKYRVRILNPSGIAGNNLTLSKAFSGIMGSSTLFAADAGGVVNDAWRYRYFGTSSGLDTLLTADPDNDGLPNWAEYLAGTDPTDDKSSLKIKTNVSAGNGAITFATEMGKQYVVEYASVGGNFTWTQLGGIITGTGAEMTVTDNSASNGRFYRVRLHGTSSGQ